MKAGIKEDGRMSDQQYMFLCTVAIIFILCFHNILDNHRHLETQALILEYQSKLTAVETEKQKTIAEFLRSVKTVEEGRNGIKNDKED